MCMQSGAPKKPKYGPCHETHGQGTITLHPPTGYSYSMPALYVSGSVTADDSTSTYISDSAGTSMTYYSI